MENNFYKNNVNDKIWWVDTNDTWGIHLFSFDKKKIYNLFKDYPHNLTKQEKKYLIKKIHIGKNFLFGEIKPNYSCILNFNMI